MQVSYIVPFLPTGGSVLDELGIQQGFSQVAWAFVVLMDNCLDGWSALFAHHHRFDGSYVVLYEEGFPERRSMLLRLEWDLQLIGDACLFADRLASATHIFSLLVFFIIIQCVGFC